MPTQFDGRELTNREFFIRTWELESAGFRGVLAALPSDKLEFRPHQRSRSAGELAVVLVSFVKGCANLCSTQQSSYNTSMHWHPDGRAATVEEMLAAYDAHHKELAVLLNKIDDRIWNHAAWVLRGEQEIILKDTVGGLLWLALFDAVHHRGQLSTYIRPMGGKVPSIYGPSADYPVL